MPPLVTQTADRAFAPIAAELPLHLIEGFFGRPWPWAVRESFQPFLKDAGFQSYIYAPKDDAFLRRQWEHPWPEDIRLRVGRVSDACQRAGMMFGIGLSPFEIYRRFGVTEQAVLRRKLDELNSVGIDLLCVLFDDMRGDMPGLAQTQVAVAHFVAEHCRAQRIVMCPTYYSTDPVLESVFGQRPANYWEDIGSQLDPAIDLFWTGPQVCSTHYDAQHLSQVAQMLGRRPFLWDNYPVNDGSATSRFLHLRAFSGRQALLDGANGHAVNPMNQPWLSRIPLRSLSASYRQPDYDPQQAFEQACISECGSAMGAALIQDVIALQDNGLDGMSEQDRIKLRRRYEGFLQAEQSAPFARELLDWLAGDYAFDPACLTG
ncbi:MAG: beta-N-acetylglucosaminidase domain-containing protein [Burkholderiaceae bacterium]